MNGTNTIRLSIISPYCTQAQYHDAHTQPHTQRERRGFEPIYASVPPLGLVDAVFIGSSPFNFTHCRRHRSEQTRGAEKEKKEKNILRFTKYTSTTNTRHTPLVR